MSAAEASPYRINKRERALVALGAEVLAEVLAPLFPDNTPEPEPEPLTPEVRAPYHELINGSNGTGVTGSIYTVGPDPMQPLSVMCRLTTSNAVADRTVAVEYRDGDGTRFVIAGTQAIVQASGAQSFCWFSGAGAVAWPVEDAAISPLPAQLLLWGWKLALVVANGDAGDVLDRVRISARFSPSL